MAKKKSKKPVGKPMAAKKATQKTEASSKTEALAKTEAAATIVVFYELSGVASVRYHSEYNDIQRARITAQTLVSSPDISQAWIIPNVEIFRSPTR
jgi:hypothetical protein